ncbi:MAG: LegC family aminotransferase [Cyclobacteriaceae bacterium]
MVNQFIREVRRRFQRLEGNIYLIETAMFGNEQQYINRCLQTAKVSTIGEEVSQLEKSVAKRLRVKYAVATSSGTAALHLSLMVCGVRMDDLVITQPFTFIATANAIQHAGAQPAFVDIDRSTLGLCPDALSRFLDTETRMVQSFCFHRQSGKRISACMPVHTFGHPGRMLEIIDICQQYNIKVVEDAAEGLGSRLNNESVGSLGDIGVFSFNGNKIVTCGGGGMLVTNDEQRFTQARAIATQSKNQINAISTQVGYNYRMPALNAALGLAQWKHLDHNIQLKRALTNWYQELFSNSEVTIFTEKPDVYSNYWLQTALFPTREQRDDFVRQTNAAQIETRAAWCSLHRHPRFRDCCRGPLPISEWAEDCLANLPSSIIPHA